MDWKLFPLSLLIILGASPAVAQENKIEIKGLLGYTFSEGVDVSPVAFDDLVVDRISPKSSFSYGLGIDYFINENCSLGFNYAQERSKLRGDIQGLHGLDFTDMSVSNYHGLFTYHLGYEDEPLRPFFFGGLGVTHHSPSSIEGASVYGSTRFSTSWGGGVKYFTSDHIGFAGSARWTPTRIKSESSGIWCSSWWPWSCWVVEESDFSHQFELSAGIVVRF